MRHSLSGAYKFKLVRYMYIYICMYGGVWHNSSACHVYVIVGGVRLQPYFFTCQPFQTVVTNGSSLLSTALIYCSESKPILYLDMVYCKFLIVEIDPFSCKQTSAI